MDNHPITIRSDFTVELHDVMGDDASIIQAMLVSTQGLTAADAAATASRINFLMKNRHGTPFEHTAMTFKVEAPIAVFREWHRHRIGVSINEMSGRYTELPGVFYVPPVDRPLVQVGKPGAYEYVPGTEEQYFFMYHEMVQSHIEDWERYQRLLINGVAKEVARGVLPVYLYSQMFWTCNARSLMAFLSLRTKPIEGETAIFPSFPMAEIDRCARQMEEVFAERFPLTHAAFVANGRVAP